MYVGLRLLADDEAFEFGDIEHLAHGARHADEIVAQRVLHRARVERIDPRPHDGERRAQFVGDVGGEFSLGAVARLEPFERLVDGMDQRHDLTRHGLLGQADVRPLRADRSRRGRGLAHGLERAPEDQDVDQQQHEQDGKGDPGDAGDERRDDIVDDHVAMRQVLGDLYPVEPLPHRPRDGHAEQDRAGIAPAHHPFAGRRFPGWKKGKPVGTRREHDLAVGVEHGVPVEAVAIGIERPHVVRNVEVEAAVRSRPQEAAHRDGLAAQGVAVQVVGCLVEQPVECQRHQDGGDADRHDVQRHHPRNDGAEARHPGFSSARR